jgi:predicted enzyme related to lactoylglutathione lyase
MTDTNAPAPAGAPIGWFEVGTDDPATARAFYGDVFGWTFEEDGPYSFITTGPDHPLRGGIQDTTGPLPAGTPSTYAVPYVQVTDVAAMVRRVEERGGKQQVAPTSTPNGLVYALVLDPAGSMIGVFSPPTSP